MPNDERKIGTDSDQLVRLSSDRSLRRCKCPELSPHYRPENPVERLEPMKKNLLNDTIERKYISDIEHKRANNIAAGDYSEVFRNDESFVEDKKGEKESLKKRSFIPPQGMDDGQYPKPLFHQYYKNRNNLSSSYTFDVLPLPFLDKLNYQGMLTLSMNDEKIQKKWQQFIDDLPNSELPLLNYPDEKFWRWKTYLRYKPDEMNNDFRYKMKVGPKYDDFGRLPITGEDLKLYRKLKPNSDVRYNLK